MLVSLTGVFVLFLTSAVNGSTTARSVRMRSCRSPCHLTQSWLAAIIVDLSSSRFIRVGDGGVLYQVPVEAPRELCAVTCELEYLYRFGDLR